jgi:hypothetical protein
MYHPCHDLPDGPREQGYHRGILFAKSSPLRKLISHLRQNYFQLGRSRIWAGWHRNFGRKWYNALGRPTLFMLYSRWPELKSQISKIVSHGIRGGITFAKRAKTNTAPGDRRGSRGTELTGSTVLCRRPLHRRPPAARIGRESLARSVAGNHTDGESHRTYGLRPAEPRIITVSGSPLLARMEARQQLPVPLWTTRSDYLNVPPPAPAGALATFAIVPAAARCSSLDEVVHTAAADVYVS